MVSSPRSRNISNLDVRINNTAVERVHETEFLGVQIDAQLSWKKHIEYTCNKKCWDHTESQKEVTQSLSCYIIRFICLSVSHIL